VHGDPVEVAHPHVVFLGGGVGEEQRRAGSGHAGPAVLALHPAADDAAELLRDELCAVADAEHRHAEVVDRRIERRRALDVHALGAAGQDDGRRLAFGHLGAVIRCGTISEYTFSSRTRRAINWAY
jgi:hypothetical protein